MKINLKLKEPTVIPSPVSKGKDIISDVVYLNLKSFRTDILIYF
jgi:hypothetical protein